LTGGDFKFLSHELFAHDHLEQIHQDLSRAIRANSTPLSETGWINICITAGLLVTHHTTGAMTLLDPTKILQDEGVISTIQIAWNVLTKPIIRDRILAMRRVFNQHRQDLGYIAFCTVPEDIFT
jgi:hypothetical protein